jgi:hypothetical protein
MLFFMHMWLIMVSGSTKAKLWLTWNQQSLAIGIQLKNALLTRAIQNHVAFVVDFN